eukprot:c14279_g1_i1.p1 GENE.c14279_g1_i1~~c14279_g1_i1.p1  ORF type:complete len:218 (+),score=29.55 c14279_g1_i1:54-707(+)
MQEPSRVLLLAEKRVVSGALRRLFTADIAQAFYNGIYDDTNTPQFTESDDDDSDVPRASEFALLMPQPVLLWRFQIDGLQTTHYTKLPFPNFTIRLVQIDGKDICRPLDAFGRVETIKDIRVRVTVHNKWADVTSEILRRGPVTKVLEDGEVMIRDWVFHDTSHKNGGFFNIRISAIDFRDQIQDWCSENLSILSDKILFKKTRDLSRAAQAAADTE